MAGDRPEVTSTLIELADTLVSGYDLLEYLDRLLHRSIEVIGADAGGVMLSDPGHEGGELQLLSCTDERARVLELFELQRQEGPCVDCHRRGAPVIEEDLQRSTTWPGFTPLALERGYRAVYALPMRLRGATIGALNLFLTEPGAAEPDRVRTAQAFADMATIGIMQQRAVNEARELASQLRIALHSRVVIEQAKGILAERLGCELDEAYQLIRWYGRDHNRRLREVAAAVVRGSLGAEDLRAVSDDDA
jgi:GAF domain-containing protein